MVHTAESSEVLSTFIGPEDPQWTRFLESTRHDVYHLPSYVSLSSKYEGGTPVAFYAEIKNSALLVPLLVSPIPEYLDISEVWCDAASPYGYPGPLLRNSNDYETARVLLSAFRKYALDNNLISVFVRLHPLLNDTPEIFGELGEVVRHGETVYVDLHKSPEEIWHDTRHDHREHIRKLQKLGFTVEFDAWSRLDGFIAAYTATMQRVTAENFYRFPESYFHELREALGTRLHLCTVQAPDGEVASGALFTLQDGISQGHLAATLSKYLQLGPSKLMAYSQIIWLKSAGASVFHLGGGVSSRTDGLFTFKAGFSKLRSSFSTCSAIINPDKYRQLVEAASGKVGQRQGFFPGYR